MSKATDSTSYSHAPKPESVRLYTGSHLLCVMRSGHVFQGEIMATRDNKSSRMIVLHLKPLDIPHAPSTPSDDPVVAARSLLDSVSGT